MSTSAAPEEEGFLRRWARRKAAAEAAPEVVAPVPSHETAPSVVPQPQLQPQPPQPRRIDEPETSAPTLDDVARLTRESDYSAFVGKSVDKTVQRLALKKLFADPHFNVMDGLDIYIDDYNKVAPLSAEMLASLKHAPGVLSSLFGEDDKEPLQENNAGADRASAPEASASAIDGDAPDGSDPRHAPPLPGQETP